MKNDFKSVVGHRFNLRADWAVSGSGSRAEQKAVVHGSLPAHFKAGQLAELPSTGVWKCALTSTKTSLPACKKIC
jgi:hypothetical protein